MEMEDKVVRSYLSMRPRYVGPVTAPKILEHKVFMVQKFSLLPTSSYLSINSTQL